MKWTERLMDDGRIITVWYAENATHAQVSETLAESKQIAQWLTENGYKRDGYIADFPAIYQLSFPYEDDFYGTIDDVYLAFKQFLEDTEFEYDDYLTWADDITCPYVAKSLDSYILFRAQTATEMVEMLEVGQTAVAFDWYECRRIY